MCACAVQKTDTQAKAFLPMLCPQEGRALIHSCKSCLLSPQVFESWPLRPDPVWSLCSAVAPSSSQMPPLLAAAVSQQSTAGPCGLKLSLRASLNCLFCLSSLRGPCLHALSRSSLGVLLPLTRHHLQMSGSGAACQDGTFIPSDDLKLHWWNYIPGQVCRLPVTFQWSFDYIVPPYLGQV